MTLREELCLKNTEYVLESRQQYSSEDYILQLEKVKSELLRFGLSQNQVKVYIYLGKYGSKTAPEIFNALNFPRTETYQILNVLQNRGIVTAEFSVPVVYSALQFEEAISVLVNTEKEKFHTLAKKQEELVMLWEQIPSYAIETNKTKKEKLQMLHGHRIHSKIREMIRNTTGEFRLFCTQKDLWRFYHDDLTEMLSRSRKDIKYIISSAKKLPEFWKDDKKCIKVMPDNHTENQCFLIKDSAEVLIFMRNAESGSNDLFAVWTDSRSFVDSMDMLFRCCWEIAEYGG